MSRRGVRGGVLAAVLAVWGCAAGARGEEGAMELVWRGGERLGGRLTGAGEGTLIFQPEVPGAEGLFPEPAEIRLGRVEELRMPEAAMGERKESFWVRLRDGSRLLAELTGLEDGWLGLESALLGAGAEVRLADVVSVERATGAGVMFFGIGPGPNWTESPRVEEGGGAMANDPFGAPAAAAQPRVRRVSRSRNAKAAEPGEVLRLWQRLPEGGLKTVSWASTLSAPLAEEVAKALPDRLRVDLSLRSTDRPRFVFKLLTDGEALRVETWNERLVLRVGERFEVASGGAGGEGAELRLTVLWDRQRGEARLLKGTGEQVARVAAGPSAGGEERKPSEEGNPGNLPAEVAGGIGVVLENLGLDLTLGALNVTRWEGEEPEAEPEGGEFARLASGQVLKGRPAGLTGGALVMEAAGGERTMVPLAKLMTLGLGRETGEVQGEAGADVEVYSRHDEWLRGRFGGLVTGAEGVERLKLRHRSFRRECALLVRPMKSVVWTGAVEEPEAGAFPERLQAGERWIRGRLTAEGDVMPRWQFDGGVRAVKLSADRPVVIERDPKLLDPKAMELAEGMTLLSLRRGDLLPARVTALNEEGLAFSAAGVLPVTMPRQEVKAVLIPGAPVETKGFGDAGWRQLRGGKAVLGAGDRREIVLEPGDALGHAGMMAGDGLDLVVREGSDGGNAGGVSSLRLTLYARNLEARETGLRVLIAFVGEEIYCGDETGEGQMRHQGQVMRTGPEVAVQIRAQGERLVMRVNGTEVVNLPLNEAERAGAGLILEPGELWGNAPQRMRVSGFEARKAAHRGRVPQVEEEARRQVLTVPRTRAEEPPTEVLIAPSGDLLRGRVEGWGEREMELRWGLETWRVPRERVAAVVLLDPPEEAGKEGQGEAPVKKAGGTAEAAPHWLLLANGGRLGLTLTRWGEDGVVGRHAHLGRVVVEPEKVRGLWVGRTPPESEANRAVTGWQWRLAEEPKLEAGPGAGAEQVGTEAKGFRLPLLEGGEFDLAKEKGRVVVLDFWASWCAPCLKGLPELMEALKGMPSDRVRLIGVNQGEPAAQVRTFLETRRWALATVLDVDQSVGKLYEVAGIPHTVVIGPDGKVAMVKTGYSDGAAGEIAAKVRELLTKE